jgi:transposase
VDHACVMQARQRTPAVRHAKASPSEISRLRQELREEKLAREAAERRCADLEEKVRRLSEQVESLLKGQRQTEEYLQTRIRKLEKDVADRDRKLRKQTKQLAWFRKKVFGSTSEKAQTATEETKREGKKKKKKKRGQQKGSAGHGRTDRTGVPIAEVIPVEVLGGCKCEKCGTSYKMLDTAEESRLFEYAESLYQNVYERRKYVSQCQCEGKKLVTAPPPPKLYPRTSIGNSLWVRLIAQKFLQGVPTNRTLKDLSLLGFSLAEGTVTGGFKFIASLLEPLYLQIANHCRAADLWNADETSWRVFDGGGAKWWLWLVASHDAVAYILDETRSGDVPEEFFAGCSGTLMTDRFAAYKGLESDIQKAWCWVHVRRDFHKIAMGVPDLKGWATTWLKRIAKLFVLNHERFVLWEKRQRTGEEWEAATTKIRKHLARMQQYWQRELKTIGLKAEQRTVVKSLQRHWEGLTLFVEDPRIPLHNNRAERLLRNAVILRKNSYGSGSKWAGVLAAQVFSIIQTWLINGLDPQKMLLEYFDECSKTPGRAPPSLANFLPWSMSNERKLANALPAGYSRPG